MHELLAVGDGTRAQALTRCREFLGRTWPRWRWAYSLLPADRREDLAPLLAWQSLTRELADADGFARRRGLDLMRQELDAIRSEQPRSIVATSVSWVVRRHDLPLEGLGTALEAWARDEHLATFETRAALEAHARALAAPEARVLLALMGLRHPRCEVLADALGIALQLTAWLANLRGEFERGRMRLPIDVVLRSGAELSSLFEPRGAAALASLVRNEVAWIRSFFEKGWPLCRELGPWNGRRLAFVLRWHAAALSAIEVAGFRLKPGVPPAGWLRLVTCAMASSLRLGPPRLSARA